MATDKSPGAQISTALPPDVAAALTALQSGGIFIGVPKGSQTEARLTNLGVSARTAQRFGARAGSFGPIGFEGYKTGSELDQLAGFGPDEIAALQQRFYDAGLIDSYLPGQLDKATRNAFKELLAESNAAGRKWTQTLDMISASSGGRASKAAQGPPPLQIQLTNPDDLKAVAQKVAQTLYGGNLPDEDLNRFVSTYNSLEAQAQTTDYNQKYSPTGYGPGGTVVTPPNASVEIEKEVRAAHPEQVAATQFGNAMDTIISTFTGSRAGR